MDNIPFELFIQIVRDLSIRDLINLRRCCKQFYTYITYIPCTNIQYKLQSTASIIKFKEMFDCNIMRNNIDIVALGLPQWDRLGPIMWLNGIIAAIATHNNDAAKLIMQNAKWTRYCRGELPNTTDLPRNGFKILLSCAFDNNNIHIIKFLMMLDCGINIVLRINWVHMIRNRIANTVSKIAALRVANSILDFVELEHIGSDVFVMHKQYNRIIYFISQLPE